MVKDISLVDRILASLLRLREFRSEQCCFVVLTFITLHAKLSSTVYCYRSCLFVCNGLVLCVFVALWVCYHDNSKLCASIFTKLGL